MVGGSDWWVGGLAVAYRGGTNQGAELAEISRVAMYLQVIVEFNAVNQEHSNYHSQVLLYSGSRPLKQAKLWCSAAQWFRGAKARLRNLTHPLNLPLPSG